MRLKRFWLVLMPLVIVLPLLGQSVALEPTSTNNKKIWMQVEVTILPLRENISRNGAILGYARKGQVLSVEKATEHWVKVRANDTLVCWVPATTMSASGPPVNWSPEAIKGILMIFAGLGISAFLIMAIALQRKRKNESQERASQAMADAKRRLQNKIQVLFEVEPRIHSRLSMDEVDLLEYLQSIGYIANLEKEPEKFLASCKALKPNLILSAFKFQTQVETAMSMDALLINTPVIYLHCELAPVMPKNLVRAYLETNATDKELSDAINICLKKSPDKIRYSVKQTALNGNVYPGTLMELHHFLAAVKKTGILKVVSGKFKAEVHFLLGNITKANMQKKSGPEAVEAVLDQVSGTFEFYDKDPVADGNAGLNTEKILMDWARKRDEGNNHTRA